MEFILVPKTVKELNPENVLKYMAKLDGRDKAMRFVQYFSRFLAWQLQQSDPKSDTAKRLVFLYKGLSLHRKAFRIGKFFDEFQKLMTAFKEGAVDEIKTQLTLVLRSCMAVFLFLDNVIWMASLKVLDVDKAGIKKTATKFRLTAAVINVILVVLDMQKTTSKVIKAQKAGDTDATTAAKVKQGTNVIAMAKNTADVITYSNSADVFETVLGSALNDGVVGIIGSVSAVAGGLAIWKKM